MQPRPFNKPVLLKAAVLIVILGAAAGSAQAAEPISVDRQSGLLHLVRQDCGSCHGMTLKGGLGPGLLPVNLQDKPDDTLVDIILDGVPETPMPPWRPLLAPGEAAWIVTQLKKGLK
ncbi:MAG: cytochrome c [Rhodospirillales bacterium]|nr:cytochrome c [Rhodospirillales bacterium]